MSELQKEDKPIVVPDSIEPVYGWKCLSLSLTGTLSSPQKKSKWPKMKPLEAECVGGGKAIVGVWKKGYIGKYNPTDLYWSTGAVADIPDMPIGPLPWGMEWQLHFKRVSHDVAGAGCSCGIYLTNDLKVAADYGHIFVKCAGWGMTTVHMNGYRVQFAYPQEIYCSTKAERKLLKGYGVPVMLISETPEFFYTNTGVPKPSFDPENLGLKALVLCILFSSAFVQSVIWMVSGGGLQAGIAIFAWLLSLVFLLLIRIT